MQHNFPYNDCSECPHQSDGTCPHKHRTVEEKHLICVFLKLRPVNACGERALCKFLGGTPCPGCPNRPLPSSYFTYLPLRPLDDDSRTGKAKDEIMHNIHAILKEANEQQYSYEDFHHIAFAAVTPEQQARHFQDVLVSTAAICDFRKMDITRCKFFVNNEGQARAETPI